MGIDLTKYDGHDVRYSDAWHMLRADAPALLCGVAHLHEELDTLTAEVVRLRADLAEAVEALQCMFHAIPDNEIRGSDGSALEMTRAVIAKHGGGS